MIDMSNGRANIAYLGSRSDVWHGLGQEMRPGMSMDEWIVASGLDWEAIKVPSAADFSHVPGLQALGHVLTDQFHIARSDTAAILSRGTVTGSYIPHQPRELLASFEEYISADPRFALDTAMSLKDGSLIVVTAKFQDDVTVAGDKHVMRLLLSTTFDATQATRGAGIANRVVCNNTYQQAMRGNKAVVSIRHNSRFNRERAMAELQAVVEGFDQYKAMGDAMAKVQLSKEEISKFFKVCLDIPVEAGRVDVSTRKKNQFKDLVHAYRVTAEEGTEPGTAWSAFNAITRYVDHDRGVRSNGNETESRFLAAQFGSGAAMKETAVQYLLETHMSDVDLVKAAVASTSVDNDSDLLRRAIAATH